jgi:hypothetical protein
VKQFMIRMDDDDYHTLKGMYIDEMSVTRDRLSFNAFVIGVLLNEAHKGKVRKSDKDLSTQ